MLKGMKYTLYSILSNQEFLDISQSLHDHSFQLPRHDTT